MKIIEEAYRLVEGPLLQQILVQMHAIIPITAKIRVVIKKPISVVPDRDQRENEFLSRFQIPTRQEENGVNRNWEGIPVRVFGFQESEGKWK
ncbi:Aldo-keto reductase family 1 member B10 [Sesbania bispinosa]|nr:Aldo-keto reductase family 1 member B10 [Sesbania bispinosa]